MKEMIRTERLTLRPMEERDYPAVKEILVSARVGATYMLPDLDDEKKIRDLFDRLAAVSRDPSRYLRAVDKEGTLIGWINETDRRDDEIEIGWVITPDAWGNGYATEAARAVIDELFAMGWKTVLAGAFGENKASMRVMEKCGMTRRPEHETVVYRGKKHDCLFYEKKSE